MKRDIIKWSVDGVGVREITRELGISIDTVILELKKEYLIDFVNKQYFTSHFIKIYIEIDEM